MNKIQFKCSGEFLKAILLLYELGEGKRGGEEEEE